MFDLYFRPRALRNLENLERKLQLKINSALDDLKSEKLDLHNIKKIEGTKFGYRLRIRRWRVLFALFSKEKRIEIVDIFLKKGRENYEKRRYLLR